MQFYKFEGPIKEDSIKAQTEQDNRRMINERNRKIALKSDAFSEKLQNKAYFFVSNMVNGTVMGGIVMEDNITIKYQIENYLKSVDIDLAEYRCEEITFRTLQNMLSAANRDCFVNDDDEILERFHLDELDGRFGRELDFNERILEECVKILLSRSLTEYISEDKIHILSVIPSTI